MCAILSFLRSSKIFSISDAVSSSLAGIAKISEFILMLVKYYNNLKTSALDAYFYGKQCE